MVRGWEGGRESEESRAAIGCSAPPMGARRCAQQQPDLACWPRASRPLRAQAGRARGAAPHGGGRRGGDPPPLAEGALLPARRPAGADGRRCGIAGGRAARYPRGRCPPAVREAAPSAPLRLAGAALREPGAGALRECAFESGWQVARWRCWGRALPEAPPEERGRVLT